MSRFSWALLFITASLAAPACRPSNAKPSEPEAAASVTPSVVPSSPSAEAIRETVIKVDPQRLAAFGIDLPSVQATLIASGIPVVPDMPGTFIMTAPRDMEAVSNTVLATRNGGVVRVRDVASFEVRMRKQ